jgi:hypothetical protein
VSLKYLEEMKKLQKNEPYILWWDYLGEHYGKVVLTYEEAKSWYDLYKDYYSNLVIERYAHVEHCIPNRED